MVILGLGVASYDSYIKSLLSAKKIRLELIIPVMIGKTSNPTKKRAREGRVTFFFRHRQTLVVKQ